MDAAAALVTIVDDDARIRTALLRLFRFARFRAHAFRTAAALLDSLEAEPPSCVVLDVHLPSMSGLELLKLFTALEAPPPVIVITADDDESLERDCKALGSRGYFHKPIDCDALLDAVREVLEAA